MNEDLHNEDKYFKSAYHHLSEEGPPPEVWNNINAALDRQDADNYRKKIIYWRVAACLLLLLLGSTAVYFAVLKTGNIAGSATIRNTKVNNNPIANASPSSDNQTGSAFKPADSITTNSFNDEKNKTVSSVPALTNHENDDNRYHPWKAFGHGKQNTEPVDYSSVKQAPRQSKSSPALTINAGKQLVTPVPATTPAPPDNGRVQPVDSSVTAAPANGIYHQAPQNTTAENHTTGIVIGSQDTANAQQNRTLQKPVTNSLPAATFFHQITLMPFFSADFTHNKLDNDAVANNSRPEDKTDIQKREKQEFSYSAGIIASFPMNPQWRVKTGAVYSNIAIGIQPQTLYASANGSQGVSYKFITSSGYAYVNPGSRMPPAAGDSISAYISQHHLQYLHIPVLLSYTLLDKKHFSLSLSEGISTNLLLSTSVETELDDDNNKAFIAIHQLQGLRPLYFSYVADANLQLYIKKSIRFTIIPSFRYAINPINKNNVVKTFPYSFGIGAGVTYRL